MVPPGAHIVKTRRPFAPVADMELPPDFSICRKKHSCTATCKTLDSVRRTYCVTLRGVATSIRGHGAWASLSPEVDDVRTADVRVPISASDDEQMTANFLVTGSEAISGLENDCGTGVLMRSRRSRSAWGGVVHLLVVEKADDLTQ